jgi:hypothetical protein
VDEEGVVQQLDGDGRPHRLPQRPAEGLARGQEQGRTDRLAGPQRVVEHEVGQVRDLVAGRHQLLHGLAGQLAVARQG